MRAALAVIVGYALWTALWLGGNALFFGAAAEVVERGEPYSETGPLLGVLGLSVICSLAAGAASAALLGRTARPVLVCALLLLATGIAVQAGVWALMPVWYHLVFLALLLPMVLAGARLAPRRDESRPSDGG